MEKKRNKPIKVHEESELNQSSKVKLGSFHKNKNRVIGKR